MQEREASESPLKYASEMLPYDVEEYKLQYNDIVDINIRTSSKELNELFNEFSMGNVQGNMMMQGAMGGGDAFFMTGFNLDERGIVELPLLGEIKLSGLTLQEAKMLIEERMVEFVNREDLFVRVRLGGIRYSALGEFRMPGKHNILQNRVTIFEAIAKAGDLTEVAKRDDLVLVRQYPGGTRMYRIDLNNKNLLTSEYFFIQPNDMLYAEPMKIRELGTGVNFVQSFSLLITTLTAALLVINLTRQ
ncbi:polysaccharide biosynthesis/export family protein [Cecembia lonarensis]|uniref:Polysaccharide biosynthesis/export protein n=1 Tax=Cecembia lonarensis (strain CCUG 58316 / KCTC 22772 / LW9) TaxID=1225176 RepID=K1LTX2_CECL9|nr:polysaccharide biosynthesis/export family protein [Cecembia lonarensis]EKB47589.1 Polysaccharide biosynthesis/export protein [Cecembia lonarensis LW9]